MVYDGITFLKRQNKVKFISFVRLDAVNSTIEEKFRLKDVRSEEQNTGIALCHILDKHLFT